MISIFLKRHRLTSCHWAQILISYWKPNDICAFFLALIITSDLVMDFFVLLVNFSWFLLPLLLFKPNVWFCSTTRRRRWTWYTWVNFGTANNETEHWTKMNWTDRRFELSKVVKLKAIQIHTIRWIQLWCWKITAKLIFFIFQNYRDEIIWFSNFFHILLKKY